MKVLAEKLPVQIQAVKWTGENTAEVLRFAGTAADIESYLVRETVEWDLTILTREGKVQASVGDWIIRGIAGEFYPCKPEIFEKTYRIVELIS